MKSTELEESITDFHPKAALVLRAGERYVWDTEPAHDNVVAHRESGVFHRFDRSEGFFW